MSLPPTPPSSAPEPHDAPMLDVSVVIPCLNEERTLGRCIAEALEGLHTAGVQGEVIVADNGSTDRSRERALAAGARVVDVPQRGYGAALDAGFRAAHGRLLVMGDADMSYDFRLIPRFVEAQRQSSADLVVGNRFCGGIAPGAMPPSHRLLGNPMLSWMIRSFFRAPLGDCYCGLRLITREAHRRLHLKSTGMEYALEMILHASLAGLKMTEVPVTLRVDGRDVPPHLKTLRDGYRSFRFIFQHGPISMYWLPGVGLGLSGMILFVLAILHEIHQAAANASGLAIVAAALSLAGWLLMVFGLIARVFAAGYLDSRVDPVLPRFFARWRLEHALAGSLAGLAFTAAALTWGWGRIPSLVLLGATAIVVSIGTFFASFVVSLMGRAVPDRRFHLSPEASPGATRKRPFSYRDAMADASAITGQNEGYSLATQRALSQAPRYNRWLAESVAEAFRGARRVLDVGCSIGNVTSEVAKCLHVENPAAQVAGLEIIPEAAGEFRRRFDGHSNLRVICADLFSPSAELLECAPFDAVVSFNVLEHLEDDVEALRRMGNLMHPGGRIGLLVPGGGERLYGTLDALDRHYRRYTPPRLRARLEEAGFEVLRIRRVNLPGYFLWWFKGRVLKSRQIETGATRTINALVPLFRWIDRLTGPPVGQSLSVVARWPGKQGAAQ